MPWANTVAFDRLARSTRDLLNTLATITAKRAGFRSLNDTWADSTTAQGLGGLAQFERELIRARTGEGRARAVANGVRLGSQAGAHPPSAARGNQAPQRGQGERRARLRARTMSAAGRFRGSRHERRASPSARPARRMAAEPVADSGLAVREILDHVLKRLAADMNGTREGMIDRHDHK